MAKYRTTITLTIDSDWPDRVSAVEGAGELVREFEDRLVSGEKLVRSAALVRKRRVNGELHD